MTHQPRRRPCLGPRISALDLLGRSTAQLPPIVILEQRPSEASVHAAAFVRPGDGTIYLIASSAPFRAALEAQDASHGCRGLDALRLIASIIVHEEWHLKNGIDERGAYYAQLTELQRLGVPPDRWTYHSVRRALRATMEAEAKRMKEARRQLALAP